MAICCALGYGSGISDTIPVAMACAESLAAFGSVSLRPESHAWLLVAPITSAHGAVIVAD